MVLNDTNIPDKGYCRHKMGYDVVYLEAHTTAYRDTQEGVGMIVLKLPQGWHIEKMRFHRMNVISCKFVDSKRTPLIGVYLPPSTL